jgi:hypothetical protein
VDGDDVQRIIYPWWEWYPEYEIQITNFPVAAGDVLNCLLTVVNNTTGNVFLRNVSRGTVTTFQVTAPRGTTLSGNSAEWVVEAPSVGGVTAPLANYGEAHFTGATAQTRAGAAMQPSAADFINMTLGEQVISRGVIQPPNVNCFYIGRSVTHTMRLNDRGWQVTGGDATPMLGGGLFARIACGGAGDNLHVLGLRANDQVVHTIRFWNNTWQDHPGDATPMLGGGDFSELACAGVGDDLHVLGLRPNGQVVHTIRMGNERWQERPGDVTPILGGGAFTRIACGGAGGQLHVLGLRANNQVMHTIRLDNERWQDHPGDATPMLGGGAFTRIACAGDGWRPPFPPRLHAMGIRPNFL